MNGLIEQWKSNVNTQTTSGKHTWTFDVQFTEIPCLFKDAGNTTTGPLGLNASGWYEVTKTNASTGYSSAILVSSGYAIGY